MTALWSSKTTVLRRVRVKHVGREPLTARTRAEQMLNAACLHPEGLAASAILCVRRFCVRSSELSSLGWREGRSIPEWKVAVAREFGRLQGAAARPALEAVPAAAEAVLFADRAELLACLARDWLTGDVCSRWWWQGLYPNVERAEVASRAWLDSPEYVPAAMIHLAAHGVAQSFVRSIGPATTTALLGKLINTHSLPWLSTAVAQPCAPSTDADVPSGADPSRPSELPARVPPPWQPWVPEANGHGLDTPRQCFLGVALMLHRAPHVVRSEAFAKDVRRWCDAMASTAFSDNVHATLNAPTPIDELIAIGTRDTRMRDEPVETNPILASVHEIGGTSIELCVLAQDLVPEAFVEAVPLESTERSRAPRVLPRAETTLTDLGGLFYLINLGLFLDLYGDFTCPARPGLTLSIWDFVFLLGRHMLTTARDDDEVWPLLTHLAGRDDHTSPGHGFEPPDAWHVPADWLRSFPRDDEWSWHATADRLRLRHPEGFCLLDVPRNGADAQVQILEEVKIYGDSKALSSRYDPAEQETFGSTPLERWLGWLLPYVRARLCRALGMVGAENIGDVLLAHGAWIEVTTTRLDVHLSLAELPCAIRLSGLDRDPGWVPAASRYIAFHFE